MPDRWHRYGYAMERGRLTADEVRAMEDMPPLSPQTFVNPNIPDCPEPGSKLVFPAGGGDIKQYCTGRVFVTPDDEWPPGEDVSGWRGTQVWKLALATAAMWVAAIVTGVMRWRWLMPNRPRMHRPYRSSTAKAHNPRPSAAKRGYGKRHQKWRKRVLAEYPICRRCEREPSTDADHITPISKGGEPYSLENGQGLCHRCHGVKTATEDGGFGRER